MDKTNLLKHEEETSFLLHLRNIFTSFYYILSSSCITTSLKLLKTSFTLGLLLENTLFVMTL